MYNLSGVMLRCTGLKYDIRLAKTHTYAFYPYLQLNSFVSKNGDCYDRFLLRFNEMLESLYLINQIIWFIFKIKNNFAVTSQLALKSLKIKTNAQSKIIMENIIAHFKYWQQGFLLKPTFLYSSVESPKGEFGVFLLTNNSNKP
jgi:NADH-quinone oxidoreductase subunit D